MELLGLQAIKKYSSLPSNHKDRSLMMSELRGSRNLDISNKGQYTKFAHVGGREFRNRRKIRTLFMDGPIQ